MHNIMSTTRKDVAKSTKTLLVMLQSCRNQQVTVTLRNDTRVKGTIIKVDADMNIELKDATLEPDPFYCTTSSSESCGGGGGIVCNSKLKPECDTDDESDFECNTITTATITATTNATCAVSLVDNSEVGNINKNTSLSSGALNKAAGVNNEIGQSAQVCDYFLVKGSRIRHIDLPSDCDLLENTRNEIERIRNRRKQWTKRDIVRSS